MGRDHEFRRHEGSGRATASQVTRRDFLKVAGVGAAALGLGGGLSGAVAACGSDSGGGDSGGGTTGRDIKVGFVAPLTGPLAAFGEADKFCVDQWNAAVKDGLTTADGETHKVQILVRDSQSDANRAATVAGDLITNDGVDMMMTASTSDTVNPVADQAEALGVPCFSSDSPWQNFVFGRGGSPDKPFKYTYHAFWGVETNAAVQLDIWSKIKTNKKIGLMCPNDADGLALADPKTGLPFFFKQAGYTIIDGGRYQDGSRGLHLRDQQVQGRRLRPRLRRHDPAGLRQLLEAVPPAGLPAQGRAPCPRPCSSRRSWSRWASIGYGLTCELWWSPVFPYKSSLTGETCQQLVDTWTTTTGKQWVQPLMHYILFEVVADTLKRTTSIDDKDATAQALKETDLDTIAGKINFTQGGATNPDPQRQRDAAGRRAVDEGQDLPVRDRDRVELGGAAGADRGRRPAPHLLRGDRPPGEPARGDGPGASARPVALPRGPVRSGR